MIVVSLNPARVDAHACSETARPGVLEMRRFTRRVAAALEPPRRVPEVPGLPACLPAVRALCPGPAQGHAEEVTDKEHANFCGWFEPRDKAFKAGAAQARAGAAKSVLDNLFGATDVSSESKEDVAKSELDKLFRDKPR